MDYISDVLTKYDQNTFTLLHFNDNLKNIQNKMINKPYQFYTNMYYMMQKELFGKDLYNCFYHAGDLKLVLFHDLFKIIKTKLKGSRIRDDFYALRLPQNKYSEYTDYHDFLRDKYYKNICWDVTDKVKPYLLSVNLALFGNIRETKLDNSSFGYFLANDSSTGINIKKIFEDTFKYFDLEYFWEILNKPEYVRNEITKKLCGYGASSYTMHTALVSKLT